MVQIQFFFQFVVSHAWSISAIANFFSFIGYPKVRNFIQYCNYSLAISPGNDILNAAFIIRIMPYIYLYKDYVLHIFIIRIMPYIYSYKDYALHRDVRTRSVKKYVH